MSELSPATAVLARAGIGRKRTSSDSEMTASEELTGRESDSLTLEGLEGGPEGVG